MRSSVRSSAEMSGEDLGSLIWFTNVSVLTKIDVAMRNIDLTCKLDKSCMTFLSPNPRNTQPILINHSVCCSSLLNFRGIFKNSDWMFDLSTAQDKL